MLLTRISSRRLGDTLIDRLQVHKNHSAKDVFFVGLDVRLHWSETYSVEQPYK